MVRSLQWPRCGFSFLDNGTAAAFLARDELHYDEKQLRFLAGISVFGLAAILLIMAAGSHQNAKVFTGAARKGTVSLMRSSLIVYLSTVTDLG